MKLLLQSLLLMLIVAGSAVAQEEDNWPSLSYLRSDYKAVAVVAHIRIQHAEITDRISGYENWKITGEVIEPFKGKFQKGDVIEYFHGAEAGIKQDYFTGEKLVFLLAEYDKDKKLHYSVLENSTLPYNENRVKKLRIIRRSFRSKRTRKSRNHSSTFAATSARVSWGSFATDTQPTSPRQTSTLLVDSHSAQTTLPGCQR